MSNDSDLNSDPNSNLSRHLNSPQASEPKQHGFFQMLRRNAWGLITLVVVAIICIVIVQVFRKPGQMSVLESQSMDMSVMVPPKGAVPVAIAEANSETISGSVTYTGSVQAFSDEDVYPRVTGRVAKMFVYPGDHVKKGQLLVQLDASSGSEYAAKRLEAASAEDAAMHNAGIAKSEFTQKKYELEATKDAQAATEKALAEAKANLEYWQPEIARQKALLQSDVVSLDEYQKELAQLNVAQAQFEQAQAKLREAKNTRLAAQAALDTMIHHVGHQYSAAKEAQAALQFATDYEDYTKIRAQEDGVVTKRLISPGVVVNQGMMLLKVAHIAKVRVQAEVAGDDADNIRLGNKVFIKGAQTSALEKIAKITAIFPAADPSSRTITVEALIDNSLDGAGYRFLPGQYVVMRISTGERLALTIPTSAVITREGKAKVWKVASAQASTAVQQYTCTMHPEVITNAPGKCPKCGMDLVPKVRSGSKEANLVDITTGLSNPEKTEVLTGLSAGDQVVYAGFENLQPGTPVVATDWGQSGPIKLPSASEIQSNRLGAANNWSHQKVSGDLQLNISLNPAKGNDNAVVIAVGKQNGGTISGAQVSIKTSMPGMGNMAGPDLSGKTGPDGKAILKSNLSSGLWQLKTTVTAAGIAPLQSTLDVEVP